MKNTQSIFVWEKKEEKICAENFYSASLVRLSLGLYYVQNIKSILYKRVVNRLLIGVFYIL